MKKIFSILAVAILSLALFSSCADSKTFKKADGTEFIANPYGWMDKSDEKIEGVQYELCAGNIVWSIVLGETIVAPVLFTGLALWEPVSYIEPIKTESYEHE